MAKIVPNRLPPSSKFRLLCVSHCLQETEALPEACAERTGCWRIVVPILPGLLPDDFLLSTIYTIYHWCTIKTSQKAVYNEICHLYESINISRTYYGVFLDVFVAMAWNLVAINTNFVDLFDLGTTTRCC